MQTFYLTHAVSCTKGVSCSPVARGEFISLHLSLKLISSWIDIVCVSVFACSVKGRHYTSKRPPVLTLLGISFKCWSYAFNNGFLSQGNFARVVLPCPEFLYPRHLQQSCAMMLSHTVDFSIILFSLQDVKV